jgi:hypothetical protein
MNPNIAPSLTDYFHRATVERETQMGPYAHSRQVTATYTPMWKVVVVIEVLLAVTLVLNWFPVIRGMI